MVIAPMELLYFVRERERERKRTSSCAGMTTYRETLLRNVRSRKCSVGLLRVMTSRALQPTGGILLHMAGRIERRGGGLGARGVTGHKLFGMSAAAPPGGGIHCQN